LINIYTSDDLVIFQQAGKILHKIMMELQAQTRVGTTGLMLERLARKRIKEFGATPSFLHYRNFPAALCVSVNDGLVHGIPQENPFALNDLVSLDLGLKYHGLCVDKAISFFLGRPSPVQEKFLNSVRLALEKAIKVIKAGIDIMLISETIQKTIESAGYSVAENLCGHGVGKKVHEEPLIPNTVNHRHHLILKKGMVLAIEPMAMMGKGKIKIQKDGFGIVSADHSLSCHFEETIYVSDNRAIILTRG